MIDVNDECHKLMYYMNYMLQRNIYIFHEVFYTFSNKPYHQVHLHITALPCLCKHTILPFGHAFCIWLQDQADNDWSSPFFNFLTSFYFYFYFNSPHILLYHTAQHASLPCLFILYVDSFCSAFKQCSRYPTWLILILYYYF